MSHNYVNTSIQSAHTYLQNFRMNTFSVGYTYVGSYPYVHNHTVCT